MPTSEKRATTAFVLITVMLDTIGSGLLIPVGPRFVASFVGDDVRNASQYFGALISTFAVMQFLFAPVMGGLSDAFGRRAIILVSLFGSAMSYLLAAFAPGLAWLFVALAISGITGASFAAANAYVADVTPIEDRAKSFGMVGAAFGLGFILGPAIGGALGDVGLRVPYLAAAGLALVNLVYGIFVLPESLAKENRRPFSLARANPLGALRALGRYKVALGLSGTILAVFLSQFIVNSTWTLDTQSRFGWSLRAVGLSLMLVGVAIAFVQGGLVRVIVGRLGERRALLFGLAASIVGYAGMGLATRGWMLLALVAIVSLSGVVGPAVQAIVSRTVAPSEQGELQGAVSSLSGVAAIVGPLVGTALFARFGSAQSSPQVPGAAFFGAAACCALGLLLALRAFARTAELPPAEAPADGPVAEAPADAP